MPRTTGRRLPLSLPRRWIIDLMHASAHLPLVTFERRMNLLEVVQAREATLLRPGWCTLFTRAYALVAARRPELRRALLTFPFTRLYEHSTSVAAVAVERVWEGEPAIFFAMLRAPDEQPLLELEDRLRAFQQLPPERFGECRRLIRNTRWPRPIRRLLWNYALNVSGRTRARYAGTFGVSVTAGLGATALNLISPLSTTLHYGPFDDTGAISIRLTFDHRVLDGAPVARALQDLEDVLNSEIRTELEHIDSLSASKEPDAPKLLLR